MRSFSFPFLLVCVLLTWCCLWVFPQELKVPKEVEGGASLASSVKDFQAVFKVSITDADGIKREKRGVILYLKTEKGNYIMVKLLEPADMKGLGFLIKGDSAKVYLPANRICKKVTVKEGLQVLVGTEIPLESLLNGGLVNIASEEVESYTVEEKDGAKVYRYKYKDSLEVKVLTNEGHIRTISVWEYGQMRTKIEVEGRLSFLDGKLKVPKVVRIENYATKVKTVFEWEMLEVNVGLTPFDFSDIKLRLLDARKLLKKHGK